MPNTIDLSDGDVARLAPDTGSLTSARDLIRKKKFSKLAVSPDRTWLIGTCKGSGKNPYEVSIDVTNITNPTCRCNCPSRKFPCKHSLALMLSYVHSESSFAEEEPSEDLVSKREKLVARKEKQAEAAKTPRKVNKAAQAKKTKAQRDGLDVLEKMVVDLVNAGQWYESSRLDKISRQAKQLNDAHLPAAAHVANELVVVGRDDSLSDEARTAKASSLLAQLWATVSKGRSYLDEKLAGDETQTEADAVVENVLGKIWQLVELEEKGYSRENVNVYELAYERWDDQARKERIEVSHLLDLNSGEMHQGIALRPFNRMQHIAEQPSFPQPLKVSKAAVYPGFLNRRIRWDKDAATQEKRKPAHMKKAYGHSKADLGEVLASFKQQLKHPLAPREAVVLVKAAKFGTVGGRVVVEDGKGNRVEIADQQPGYSKKDNFVLAGGMLGKDKPAVLLKLYFEPTTNTIFADPLAMVTAKHHLRMGM